VSKTQKRSFNPRECYFGIWRYKDSSKINVTIVPISWWDEKHQRFLWQIKNHQKILVPYRFQGTGHGLNEWTGREMNSSETVAVLESLGFMRNPDFEAFMTGGTVHNKCSSPAGNLPPRTSHEDRES
jgi:hypothetical protein